MKAEGSRLLLGKTFGQAGFVRYRGSGPEVMTRRASAPEAPMFNVVSQRGYVSVDGYRKEIAQLKSELQRKSAMLESQEKEAMQEGEKLRRQIRELQNASTLT